MNVERACEAVETAIREYMKARSAYKKDDKTGEVRSQGMTLISPDDRRIEEIARLAIEAVLKVDDGKGRIYVEARALTLGDEITRYMIKDGIAVDEEVVIIKSSTVGNRTTLRYRRPNDAISEVVIDATYLVSTYRASSKDELRKLIGAAP